MSRLKLAAKASAIHTIASCLIASLAAVIVFIVWFPFPYRMVAGGEKLFWTVVAAHVVCGPLLTLIVFDPKKSRKELGLDIGVIVFIQSSCLCYGLYVLSAARPVVLAFETDRFVVVSAAQIDPAELSEAIPEVRQLPWSGGPRVVATRTARSGEEALKSLELSLQGKEPSARPAWWIPYPHAEQAVQSRMKPLTELRARAPGAQQLIDSAALATGRRIEDLFYLPLTSRRVLDEWVVLLDKQAGIVGYAPVGGF